MKKRRIIGVLAVAFALGFFAQAQAQVDYGDILDYPPVKGQSLYAFLKVAGSPRAIAMGSAYTAMPGDIESIFQNPGGLGFLTSGQYTLSYTRWLANSKLITGAAAYRLGSNVVGISIINARPEAVEETTILNPLGTGRMINGGDIAVGLVFARQMTDKVSWGIQARWIQEDLFLEKSTSFEGDLGVSAYTGYKSLRLAASARNIGGTVTVETRPFSPPIYFNFGAAGEVFGNVGDPSYLTLSLETLFATDYGERWHFGGEYWFQNTLALRAGYITNTDVQKYSFGVGLKRSFGERNIRVDISYSDGGHDFDAPLRFSLGGSF